MKRLQAENIILDKKEKMEEEEKKTLSQFSNWRGRS